jgi:uncharacterized protein
MSSANLDLVRSIFSAHERGDFSSTEWAHPQIEWVLVDGPAPGTWTGVARMREGFRDLLEAWDCYRSQPNEYREIDGERVLVIAHASARGKTSGAEVGHMRAHLFDVRDGKVIKIVNYFDSEHALAALDLAEKDETR